VIRIVKLLTAARRSGEDDEAGFSIVELLASLTVLAIGIVSMLGTLVVAARAAGTQRGRVNAVYAANLAFENIRSRPYDHIAICDCDPDLAISPTTQTATTGPVRAELAEESVPVRPDPIVLAGVTYSITQNILWLPVDDQDTGKYYEQAYKLAVVRVALRDHIGDHQIQLESAIYPAAQSEVAATCADADPLIQPDELSATSPPEMTPSAVLGWRDRSNNECRYDLQVLVLPSRPAQCMGAGFEAQWLTVVPGGLPANATSYVFAGEWERWYCFRIRAVNRSNEVAGGQLASDWVYSNPIATPPAPSPDCVLTSPQVRSPAFDQNATPNRVRVHASTGMNWDDIAVVVSIQGICTRIWAIFINKNGQQVETGDFTLTGIQGFVVLPSSWQAFALGYSNVTIKAEGVGNPQDAIVRVCYYKGGGGKPSC
jgi:type II secretory pathway pseudopilin PulG